MNWGLVTQFNAERRNYRYTLRRVELLEKFSG